MESSTIQLEAFNTNLNGARILCNGSFHNKIPPIMEFITDIRNPFKKKVLISNTIFGLNKYLPFNYDVVFQAKDSNDWTMIVTYLTYVVKPVIVICDVSVPDQLWQKINRTITFVHIIQTRILNLRPYDAIFFEPIQELHSNYTDYIYKILQSIYRNSYTQTEHKEVIQELRVAKAGIAWTKLEEDTQSGNIYWYDPILQSQSEKISTQQLSELFTLLSQQFKSEE
jgi:hypothetical protein